MITPDSGTSAMTFPVWAWNKVSKQFPDIANCNDEHNLGTLTYNIILPFYNVYIVL